MDKSLSEIDLYIDFISVSVVINLHCSMALCFIESPFYEMNYIGVDMAGFYNYICKSGKTTETENPIMKEGRITSSLKNDNSWR